METTHRQSAPAQGRLGRLVIAALALGTVTASALTVSAAGAANAKQVTLSESTAGKMGKVLFVNGKAVYVLSPSASPCDASCLKIWPPLTLSAGVSSATAGKGVQHSKVGTTAGPNGLRQVTYGGKPLYFFAGDNVKGKVKGNVTDQWGKWTAVVVAKAPSGSGSSSSGSSGGSNAGSGGASF
jgi:predicted lipoprotein with Yx(FWY)xxD motif